MQPCNYTINQIAKKHILFKLDILLIILTCTHIHMFIYTYIFIPFNSSLDKVEHFIKFLLKCFPERNQG